MITALRTPYKEFNILSVKKLFYETVIKNSINKTDLS